MSASAVYTYKPAYKQFGSNVHIVHFLGETKPWSYQHSQIESLAGSELLHEHLHLWWSIFLDNVVDNIKDTAHDVSVPEAASAAASAIDDVARRSAQESGHPDFKGRDSFENISAHLDKILAIEVVTPKK